MAVVLQSRQLSSTNNVEILSIDVSSDTDKNRFQEALDSDFDYSQRGQWLRAAVLGANDGLVSVASLMMGVGSVKKDLKAMILAGFAGMVAGACSMAIGEFVSVYTQRDVEIAQMKRTEKQKRSESENGGEKEEHDVKEKLPNPLQAAVASALAFSAGAVLPLLAAAFIRERKVRIAVVAAVVTLALTGFGAVGAVVGGTPVMKSSARVLIGGWIAMTITFGLTKLIGSYGI